MPTYQYRCSACSNEIEAVQKFTDPALTECPACSGQLRKVFNAVGVVFKGSGFYRTDSRAEKKNGGSTGSNGKTESSSGDTSSGDSGSGSTSSDKSGGKQPATAGSSSGGAGSAGSSAGGTSGAGSSSTAA